MVKRMKNPWFWVGIVGIILTAMGIDPSTLTSWGVVGHEFMNLVTNPFMLVTVVMAVLGVFVDPSTSGFKDLEKYASDEADESEVRDDIEKKESEVKVNE
jgi:phi LC3 family holin